jgi:hypothetical protein
MRRELVAVAPRAGRGPRTIADIVDEARRAAKVGLDGCRASRHPSRAARHPRAAHHPHLLDDLDPAAGGAGPVREEPAD